MIRDFEANDGNVVLTWFDNEQEFKLWAVDRFENYPIKAEDLNDFYKNNEIKAYSFINDGVLSGHFTMRFLNENTVRLALIAVDKNIRGKGIGQKMLNEAFTLVKNMGAEFISICVFDENVSAVKCYKKLGLDYTGEYERYSLGKYKEMKKAL